MDRVGSGLTSTCHLTRSHQVGKETNHYQPIIRGYQPSKSTGLAVVSIGFSVGKLEGEGDEVKEMRGRSRSLGLPLPDLNLNGQISDIINRISFIHRKIFIDVPKKQAPKPKYIGSIPWTH